MAFSELLGPGPRFDLRSIYHREARPFFARGSIIMPSYESYSLWKHWNEAKFGRPTRDDRAYCDAELGPFLNNSAARVFELGFGNGGVLGWCRERGHDATGVESNPGLVAKGLEAEFDVTISLEEARARCGDHVFDLAVAFDVLEHIPVSEIPMVLQQIHALLKPEAVLLIRVPNGDSPFGRAYQYADITHVTAIGTGQMQWFAAQTNFKMERVKEPATPWKGASVWKICKRLSAKAARRLIDWLISNIYFAGAIRVFSANLLFVLRASCAPVSESNSPNPIAARNAGTHGREK